MGLLEELSSTSSRSARPFLIAGGVSLSLNQVMSQKRSHLEGIKAGDVVALIGNFDAQSISDLLALIDRRVVLVPLTKDTQNDHEYFFQSAMVKWIVEGGNTRRRNPTQTHPLLIELAQRNHAGLVLFSTGTTGRPKAILHDMDLFLSRFLTPRPTLRTMAFLLFDHIGGINTLFHTLFNEGVIISPSSRSVSEVLETCRQHQIEVLPTTPTFLRIMLISGLLPAGMPKSVKIISYGTERMDQSTLNQLCGLLPGVDFRQTYGMSELGILRVMSQSRDSLFMKVGGEGVSMKIENGVLKILSSNRMMGYLNAESPFGVDGWYDTKDFVDVDGDFIRVVGRSSEVINVGGLKFMASEVERVVLGYPGVALVDVRPRRNPITGEHVEITVECTDQQTFDVESLRSFLKEQLPEHMIPRRILESKVSVGHRFKRL